MKIFYIDLFSGAGGTTTGIHLANENIQVVACVNHDEKAIESHKANHPDCLHFVEDVRDMKVIKALANVVKNLRKQEPDCIIIVWASLECTNYSKAKGGLPRDADSRTLAYSLYDYAQELNPDGFQIENVREFMAWGPLDESGKPISRLNGTDYAAWVKKMCSFGYNYEWKLLNAADYGAYTSRERYFGQFIKPEYSIAWPEPTHSKNADTGTLFENHLKPWNPVKDVLDLTDEGESIFNRRKPLVEATLKRIYAGLIKFVAGGDKEFLLKYNSMNQLGNYKAPDIKQPSPVVSTQSRLGIVKASFLNKNYSGCPNSKVLSINKPAGTITTIDHHSLVNPIFLSHYYGNGFNSSVLKPCPTLRTKDSVNLVNPNFIDQQYGQGKPIGTDKPATTLTAVPKLNLVQTKWLMDTNFKNIGSSLNEPSRVITASRKYHYLMNPQYNNKGKSLNEPCFTLIARMDKMPPYLIQVNSGKLAICIAANDTPTMIKIKEFMAIYGIVDIKMRMLRIPELLKIQGFPDDYILKGTQADQKKFIGNAVVPIVAKAIVNASYQSIVNKLKKQAV